MNIIHTNRLRELKIRAALLLKDFNAEDPDTHHKAAQRFLKLPFLQYSTAERILNDRDFFRLKHAYAVLALENGHDSWNALREQVIQEDCLYTKGCAGFINTWFTNYNQAKAHHIIEGGYLLQYRQDYFVAGHELIKVLGLHDFEKEWEAIGYDWVKPQCTKSWARLYKQAKANYIDLQKA